MVKTALIICCFLVIETVSAQGKLYIIGGGPRPPELIRKMIEEAGLLERGYVSILPLASEEQDSAIWYARKQFSEAKVTTIQSLIVSPGKSLSATQLDSLEGAALIYITGGDQTRFMQLARSSEIVERIQSAFLRGAMIAGTSAGAAVMGELMVTGDQKRYKEYNETFRTIESDNIDVVPALSLLKNSIIDQHFLKRSRHNRLLTAILEHPGMTGIGIDESTALLVSGSAATVFGSSQVLVFRNPKRSVRKAGTLYGGNDLRLDIYLPGESFRLSARQ